MKLAALCVLKENVLLVLNRILKSYRIWKKNRKMKLNKTCLGRFQDCGRGKGKNM
jgi:hypothetical protein